MQQLPLGVQLRTAAVFKNFYVGPNLEAMAALRSAETNPLWLWGTSATGKTHLLQALCADTEDACAYFPLRQEDILPPEALEGFERLALLCIDDLDAVAGQAAWEKSLFAAFNSAADNHTRLVFAASTAPTAIPWTLADWASRAASCTVYQLRALNESERVEALRMRAGSRGLELPTETAQYLLKRVPRDQQALFDLLDTLDSAALAAQRRLTVPFVREALKLS